MTEADTLPSLTVERLIIGGFERAGSWILDPTGRLVLDGTVPSGPGVYAFVVASYAQYVGLASINLARRLYGYGRPGSGQLTNMRLNGLLTELLKSGESIDIYTASPPDLDWNGWTVSGAEGLEAAMIREHRPVFNKKGVPSATAVAVVKSVSKSARQLPAAERDGLSDADRVRRFVDAKLFTMARQESRQFVAVAAREVHDRLGLKNAFPTVCQALSGNKLQEESNVRLIRREGPERSSTTVFHFELF